MAYTCKINFSFPNGKTIVQIINAGGSSDWTFPFDLRKPKEKEIAKLSISEQRFAYRMIDHLRLLKGKQLSIFQ